jgi:hypothetical protein
MLHSSSDFQNIAHFGNLVEVAGLAAFLADAKKKIGQIKQDLS